jgi:hypothetical protein
MKNVIVNLFVVAIIGCVMVVTSSCSETKDDISLPTVCLPQTGSLAPIAISCDSILKGTCVDSFKVSIDKPSSSCMMCDVKVDTSLVKQYNAQNGTDYQVLPSTLYTLAKTTAMIPGGDTVSNT